MKKTLLILLILPVFVAAQFSVVSTLPANNATNVPLQTTISITFSEALDTNVMNSEDIWFSNIDWESTISYGYSEDLKSTFGVYNLQPNTTYFIAFIYAKALSGATITTPFIYYFTTGSSFPSDSVSGTLSAGTTGISLEHAVAGLATGPIGETDGRPEFAGWTNVNANGTFTIPYVSNGTYWPLAVKDVDGNGMIDPSNGDAIAVGDSIVVNNASVSNVDLTFMSFELNVVSTLPANNAVNVPLQTTLSITFDQALDTMSMDNEGVFFTNINFDDIVSPEFSSDGKTSSAVVNLQPNTSYFFALMYARSTMGAKLTSPFVFYFTTGSSFPTATVSGTVVSGTSGVTPEDAVVGLMKQSIFETEGEPEFVAWANVNSNGTFSIPYVPNGTYWPLAAKDVNKNGVINPDHDRDAIAFADSVVVNNASVSNVILEFIDNTPKTYHQAMLLADSMANLHLPADRVLRYVNTWGVDTLGRGIGTWHFWYTGNDNTVVYDVPGSKFEGGIDSTTDPWQVQWVGNHKPINNHALAAPSPSVIMNTENAGGRDFRMMPVPIEAYGDIEMTLGGHTAGEFFGQVPDTNAIYWNVRYIWEVNYEPWILNGRKFLCDFTTGAILLNQTMSVLQKGNAPMTFELLQNYPNPFNPSTTITFSVPARGHAVLKVFNMLGQEVATLFNGEATAGTYTTARFNAAGFASGLYVARLEYGGRMQMKKMMLLK
ncbi:MAG: Ig-like domain-containing protein [Bacteroidota bacterium]